MSLQQRLFDSVQEFSQLPPDADSPVLTWSHKQQVGLRKLRVSTRYLHSVYGVLVMAIKRRQGS